MKRLADVVSKVFGYSLTACRHPGSGRHSGRSITFSWKRPVAPLYVGQPSFEELYRFLCDERYRMIGVSDTVLSPVDGSVLQSDLLFSRSKL